MKHMLTAALAAATILFSQSMVLAEEPKTGADASPSDTVQDYYDSLERGWSATKSYTSGEFWIHALQLCDCAASKVKDLQYNRSLTQDSAFVQQKNQNRTPLIQITPTGYHYQVVAGSEKLDGDNATVSVRLHIDQPKAGEKQDQIKTVELRKNSGDWLVRHSPARWHIYMKGGSTDPMPAGH